MLTTTTTTTSAVTTGTTKMMTSRRSLNSIPTSAATTTTTKTTTETTATTTTIIKTMTTITSDPGILCFHHCNVKVFCFTLPHTCPQCKTALATHPNGGNGSGGTSSKSRRKNKKKTLNNNNSISSSSSSSSNSNNNSLIHANNSNNDDYGDDDDVYNKNDADENDDGEDDDDDDDINENTFACHIMTSRLLPFRLPYPFVRANQYPCAIVLRPTTGDFLKVGGYNRGMQNLSWKMKCRRITNIFNIVFDYNNTTDLHIAVTTSTGCVVEFDRHGLRRHRTDNMSEWWQCLLVGDVPEPWYDYWDQVLFEICQLPDKWTVSHYHEDKHNCYTFVLTFLQALTYDKLSEAARSKTRFCEKYIVPRTTTAGKYISLYRKLRDAGIYVHHTNHNKVRGGGGGGGGGGVYGYGKQGSKHQQHQQLEQQQLQLHQQRNSHKSNNSSLTTTTTSSTRPTTVSTKNGRVSNKYQQQKQQQQHLSNHHNHHSIISRPHSTLCTIEE